MDDDLPLFDRPIKHYNCRCVLEPRRYWWTLWSIPTERGKKAFKWEAHQIGARFEATEEDARLERYLQECDDRTPDMRDYYSIELRRMGLRIVK